ncbi:MAG: hypothetical protein ACLU0O_13210 [Collinsella sp.]
MMDINTLLALDLAEYTTALEALADQMMLEEPRDIDYMRRRKLDTGREFAVWNFTVGYCMNAADALSSCEPKSTRTPTTAPPTSQQSTTAPRACATGSRAPSTLPARWTTRPPSSPTAATSTPR